MKKFLASFCLVALNFPSAYADCNHSGCVYFSTGGKVIKVCADGSKTQLKLSNLDVGTVGGMHYGTSAPAVSPDGCYISYNANHNLWLYDTRAKTARQITTEGKPADDQYAPVQIYNTLWSSDSSKLVFYIMAEDWPVGDEGPELSKRKNVPEGFYIYDTKIAKSVPLPMPETAPSFGKASEWAPKAFFSEDKILLLPADLGENRALIWDYLHKRVSGETRLDNSRYSQSNGNKVLFGNSDAILDQARVMMYDVVAATATEVAPYDSYASYQKAIFSPSGSNIAFIKNNTVSLKNKAIVIFPNRPRDFAWVDENTIVTSYNGKLYVTTIGEKPVDYSHTKK